MTIEVSRLGHSFAVSSASISCDFSTRLNIKKRIPKVIYRTISDLDNINLEYLVGEKSSAANNIFISDRSTSITQNRLPSTTINKETTGALLLNVEKFLVTDIFTEDMPTSPSTPLFHKHQLVGYNDTLDDFASRTLLSIEFADYTQTAISFREYYIDTTDGYLYNNIENTYNDDNNLIDIKYVKYTVRVAGSTTTTLVYHELIDNKPVFLPASWDDIDEWGNVDATKKAYLVSAVPGGTQFEIKLPTSALYAWKELPESRLKVLYPTATDTTLPWNVRITNGSFMASLKRTSTTTATYIYNIAEFNSQVYDPYPPYKFQTKQTATWIYDNLIKTPKNIVREPSLYLSIDVVVKDRAGEVKYIYSSDEDKIGTTYQNSSVLYTDGILSIDRKNGFIEVADTLRSDDKIVVYYYSEEDEYLFNSIDFNPVSNVDIINERIVIYVIPETTYTGELSTSLQYLKVDPAGRITYSSQAATGGILSSTAKLLSEDFYTTGTPKHTFYYDVASTVSGLNVRVADSINLEYIDEFSFIDKYTVESCLFTSQSGIADVSPVSDNLTENPHFLVLADVYVGSNQSPQMFSRYDVRKQGGGIKEGYESLALEEDPDVSQYVDLNINRPYPSAGSCYIQIPQTLLTDKGGDYTIDQIRSVINRHMRAGGWAIIRPYGLDPNITSAQGQVSAIQIMWPSYTDGAGGISYNAYFSQQIDRAFVLASGSPFTDTPGGNTLTLDGLSTPTKYYLYIEAVDEDGIASRSQTVTATTIKP